MESCIFCKIISGAIPAKKLYEDDDMIIINDISPQAVKHYLLIPKKHYKLIADMSSEDGEALMRSLSKLPSLQSQLGLDNGFRLVINQGEDAGQTVFHLHVHVLGGERLAWPAKNAVLGLKQ